MNYKEKPFYGYYAFGRFQIILTLWIVFSILIATLLWHVIGIVFICFGVYMYLTYWLGAYLSKTNKSYDLSKILDLHGSEYALDVGCGLGKLTISIAKLINKGSVVGIDIWDKMDISNVSQRRAYKNAEIEGMRDKIEFKTGYILDIPFPDNSFDLVTAGGVLLAFWSNKTRFKALSEILRVLRPRGKFLLLETLRNPRTLLICPGLAWKFLSKRNCINLVEKTGFVNLKYNSYETVMGCLLVEKPKKV